LSQGIKVLLQRLTFTFQLKKEEKKKKKRELNMKKKLMFSQ